MPLQATWGREVEGSLLSTRRDMTLADTSKLYPSAEFSSGFLALSFLLLYIVWGRDPFHCGHVLELHRS